MRSSNCRNTTFVKRGVCRRPRCDMSRWAGPKTSGQVLAAYSPLTPIDIAASPRPPHFTSGRFDGSVGVRSGYQLLQKKETTEEAVLEPRRAFVTPCDLKSVARRRSQACWVGDGYCVWKVTIHKTVEPSNSISSSRRPHRRALYC